MRRCTLTLPGCSIGPPMSLARGEAWLSLNERLSSGRSQLEIPQIEREIHAGRKAWLFVGTKVVYVTEEEHGQADGNQLQQYNEERTPLCHECNTEAQVRQLECTIYRIYWYWADLFMTRGWGGEGGSSRRPDSLFSCPFDCYTFWGLFAEKPICSCSVSPTMSEIFIVQGKQK